METTSYKHVITAFKPRNPDRPPINYIATPEIYEKLKKHLKIEDQEELLCHLCADIHYVAARYVGPKDLVEVKGINTGGKEFWG